MPRDLRYVPPGSLVEVTCRTIQGRYLLRPSPELNEIFYGVLGRALDHSEVEIVAFKALSNHFHGLLLPEDAEALARFMGFVECNLSKEIGRLHGWRGSMWADRYHSVIVSDEPEAQIARLKYLIGQGVGHENLVRRPEDWPGPSSIPQLLAGGMVRGKWFDRTAEYEHRRRLRRRGEAEWIERTEHAEDTEFGLGPLPPWRHLPKVERQRLATELARECEAEGHALRNRTGKPCLGVKKILRADPHDQPASFRPTPRPRFHAVDPTVRVALEKEYRRFADAYRDATADLLAGRRANFPAHSFPRPKPFWRGKEGNPARGPDP